MKTLILTAALAVSTALAGAQKPAPTSDDSVEMKKTSVEVAVLQHANDEVTLLMEKAPRELVRIKVYEGNKLIYMQRVKKEATANITYDISEFPDGNYTIEVVKDKEVVYTSDIKKGPELLADNK
jgi:hypothetical protein